MKTTATFTHPLRLVIPLEATERHSDTLSSKCKNVAVPLRLTLKVGLIDEALRITHRHLPETYQRRFSNMTIIRLTPRRFWGLRQ